MKQITKAQITKIHVLLAQFNVMEDKPIIILQFTNERTSSTKEMTMQEASNLLKHLSKFDPCDKMRRKIFALAYDAGIIYGDTLEDKKMNAAKLNMFLRERGTVKKELNFMNKEELTKVVNQFAQIVKHNTENNASKLTKSLLSELNITTTKKKYV